jgi:hypothetical protein
MCGGNPGSLTFLMSCMNPEAGLRGVLILDFLTKKGKNIRGDDLYILYSDLGNKDINRILDITRKVPINILEDACSRQDYKGIDMIKEYMNE